MAAIHICPDEGHKSDSGWHASLPAFARSSINRCNLPSVILGSHTYQQHPIALFIDGVAALHGEFFRTINSISEPQERAVHFHQYMVSAFLLDKNEEAGFSPDNRGVRREKADYLRLLRGWMFDSSGIEAAVFKRWVESRFGLLTLNHREPLGNVEGASFERYQADYVRGLYNSNALEAQLDLVYSYCQYELQRRWPERQHWVLYRGINHIQDHHQVGQTNEGHPLLVLNNLNSFSCDRHLSETFGDVILEVRVPVAKLMFFPELLPNILKGEGEFLALGGVYQVSVLR